MLQSQEEVMKIKDALLIQKTINQVEVAERKCRLYVDMAEDAATRTSFGVQVKVLEKTSKDLRDMLPKFM
ncbi:hypothetical protein SY88_11040 [Clostridiales bacterium PH28_bin88]|nr:hypothetical protein SY88_11040 [Clostridiales bacterium PH28_bin88]